MIGKGRPRHYDPETCFNAWIEAGTLELARHLLYNKGIKSVDGGIPPLVSVQFSANSYMIQNPEEARKRLIEEGNLLHLKMDSEWYHFIIRRAKNNLQAEVRFFHWLLNEGLLEKARELKLVPRNYGENRSV